MASFLLCLTLVSIISCGYGLSIESKAWDHLMFVQQWPQTACTFESGHQCDIPDFIDSWTIHGIWPNLGKERGPSYCNDSWKFDETKIMDIEEALVKHWPNLYVDTPETDFWKHEWEKHGTCATTLEALGDEHKFFSAGLALNKRFNIMSVLNESNIVPSNTAYKNGDIVQSLESAYGAKVCVECKYSKHVGQKLFQVIVCLDKTFRPMDCPACEEECWSDEGVGYPPIQHDHVWARVAP